MIEGNAVPLIDKIIEHDGFSANAPHGSGRRAGLA